MGPTTEAGRGLGRIPGVAEEPDPPFGELLRACSSSAVHLEMRDSYDGGDPWFQAWRVGDQEEFRRRLAPRPWLDLIAEVTGRGVEVRRVRIVSEPVSDYIRFEHATTASNVTAGERIRWLPRQSATGLLLPRTTSGFSTAGRHSSTTSPAAESEGLQHPTVDHKFRTAHVGDPS